MCVLFVVGVMNLVWVAALTVFVLVEKIGPAGALVARVAGVAMIAAGAFVWSAHLYKFQLPPSSVAASGGTGVSGRIGGFFVWKSVACSKACASASTLPSEKRGPAIISPTGSPFDVKPHGTEIAGMP